SSSARARPASCSTPWRPRACAPCCTSASRAPTSIARSSSSRRWRGPEAMAAGARSALACAAALAISGCIATISQPRGAAHLAAMREATRHYHHGRYEEAARAWGEAARTAERRVDRDEAEYRRARTLLDLDRDREALSVLDAIARRRPISRRTVRARFDA